MAEKEPEKEKKPKQEHPSKPTAAQLEAQRAAKQAQKAVADAKGKGPKAEGGEQVKPAKVRLKDKYASEVVPSLMQKFGFKNKHAVPRLVKVCLNMGFGKAATENNPKAAEVCITDLGMITGQKAVVTVARKSVSNFKLREGMQIGCRVTLRGAKMYEFLDRLFNIGLPRVRDFRGLSPRACDGRGNYSMGLAEQSVFPEIDTDKMEQIHGMDITICTTARKDEQTRELLKALGCPFRER
jgi:large subunit ribosomal protein L5